MYLRRVADTEKRAVLAMAECTRLGLDEAIGQARQEQKALQAQGYSYAQATLYAAKIMEDAAGICHIPS